MDYDKDRYQTQTNFRGSILNVLRISLMDGPFLCLSLCYTYWGWVRSGIRQASPVDPTAICQLLLLLLVLQLESFWSA